MLEPRLIRLQSLLILLHEELQVALAAARTWPADQRGESAAQVICMTRTKGLSEAKVGDM